MEFDQQSSNLLSSLKISGAREIFRLLTGLGSAYICFPVYLLLFLFCFPCRQAILSIVVAELLGFVFIPMLRLLTKRARPDKSYRGIRLLPWTRYSFPSHHSMRSFMMATVATTHFPSLGPIIFLYAVLIGFSRVYLSRHYLFDVLAGGVLGMVLALFSLNLTLLLRG